MTSISPPGLSSKIIVGVDTHKHVHVAVALDEDGQRLGDVRVPVDSAGYQELDRWALTYGRPRLRHRGHRQLRGQPHELPSPSGSQGS